MPNRRTLSLGSFIENFSHADRIDLAASGTTRIATNGPFADGSRVAATARLQRVLVAHDVPRVRNGGMSRLMGYIHDQVAARGVTIDYFCSDDRETRASSRIARLTFPLAVYRHARAAARAGSPYDIINVHEPVAAAMIAGRRALGNPAVVVTTHGIERRGWERTLEESRLGRDPLALRSRMSYPLTTLWQANYSLRHADHIFCLNFEDREYLLEHYGRSPNDVTRIFPGAASVYAIAARRRDYSRARTILFAGTWLARKGIRDLSAAFTMLRTRNPEFELHVLGSGAGPEIVRDAFPSAMHAAIRTTTATNEERSAAAFADADIYVLPSLFEGTPLTLIEAMASGLPIVTTATCGMRDVIKDNENGLLVPIRSPEAIAKAIQRLVDDRALRERLGRTAAAEANRNYTWERAALPVAEIYTSLRPTAEASVEIRHLAKATAVERQEPAQKVSAAAARARVLFFVEGHTDIRFVTGLSEICDLTMAVAARPYTESGLKQRVAQSGLAIEVIEIPGGRAAFQARSIPYLWRLAPRFDLIVAQEVLRGALNANVVGKLRGVPVVTYMGIAPLEYFGCRRERGQIGALKAMAGKAVIRSLLAINGILATRCLAMGPYLIEVGSRYCSRTANGLYYGVDTTRFRPASEAERAELRRRLDLPPASFVVFFSSRISHEKDPETVLRAVSLARERGVDAVLLNLGGGWRDFVELAQRMGLRDSERWVIGRPAAHPMTAVFEYFRAVDALAQASLAEGAAYATLEALACGTPVAATAVGGMARQLAGYARLVPRRDATAMADELMWIASHRDEARAQALRGREYVVREWDREKAFADLSQVFAQVSAQGSAQVFDEGPAVSNGAR